MGVRACVCEREREINTEEAFGSVDSAINSRSGTQSP